jgi:nicotinamide-nucleotide amidase
MSDAGTIATAAVLCIGTELTRGEITNSNAGWLAERLTELGLEVTAIEAVPDAPQRIEAALRRLASEHDAVVCTGGLGPTTDDLTSECVARVLGVPLQQDPQSLATIQQRLSRFGRTMAASNAKQADFPEGARVLANPHGTAPGFAVAIGAARAYFMPGVPREMKPMFDERIAPELAPLVRLHTARVRLRCFGAPESTINDALAGIERECDVIIAYRAHFPEIEVKALARAESRAEAEARAQSAARQIKQRLGTIVYGEGEAALPDVVGELLEQRQRTIGLAESCTGGLVAELLSERAGASRYFTGAVVAYSNLLKQELLGVPGALLERHGAVSEEVAGAMARGALQALGTDIALSVTGIAGPSGGSPDKPVGLVYYAAAMRAQTLVRRMSFPGPRSLVRRMAAWNALWLVRELLLNES